MCVFVLVIIIREAVRQYASDIRIGFGYVSVRATHTYSRVYVDWWVFDFAVPWGGGGIDGGHLWRVWELFTGGERATTVKNLLKRRQIEKKGREEEDSESEYYMLSVSMGSGRNGVCVCVKWNWLYNTLNSATPSQYSKKYTHKKKEKPRYMDSQCKQDLHSDTTIHTHTHTYIVLSA